jgi:hypothetical protein
MPANPHILCEVSEAYREAASVSLVCSVLSEQNTELKFDFEKFSLPPVLSRSVASFALQDGGGERGPLSATSGAVYSFYYVCKLDVYRLT